MWSADDYCSLPAPTQINRFGIMVLTVVPTRGNTTRKFTRHTICSRVDQSDPALFPCNAVGMAAYHANVAMLGCAR